MIKYKGQDYSTEIVDTAGQDEYSILNSKHFIGIHGYMLVYSVSSLPSFEMVQVIREKILNHLVTTVEYPDKQVQTTNQQCLTRVPNPSLSSSSATRATCDPSNDKLPPKMDRRCPRRSNAAGPRRAHDITRTSAKRLSS
jgi:hypothetical protein